MKTLFALFAITAVLGATPILLPDSVALSPDDPGIARHVYTWPGSLWGAWFNDNPGGELSPVNDFDFNDWYGQIKFNADGTGSIEYLGSTAAYTNVVLIYGASASRLNPGPASFTYMPSADPVILYDHVLETGQVLQSGTRNFWTDVPEPGTLVLIGLGLVVLALIRRR